MWPEAGGTPRRINHQIVYEDAAGRSPLAASVAISLVNPNAFRAETARGQSWGQCAVGADLDDTGGTDRGAVYVLFLNPDGTVADTTKIADGLGGLPANHHSRGTEIDWRFAAGYAFGIRYESALTFRDNGLIMVSAIAPSVAAILLPIVAG